MIMGLGASSRLWYRLLPWLSRRHRVILFDNRGTGDSAPVRSRLTMASTGRGRGRRAGRGRRRLGARDRRLDGRHDRPAHRARPPRPRALAGARLHDARRPQRRAALAAAGGLGAAPAARLAAARSRSSRRCSMRRGRATERPDRAARGPRAADGQDNTSPLTRLRADGSDRGTRHAPAARRAEPALPTLVVHGLEDALIPPDRGRELAELIPGARLELIPSAATSSPPTPRGDRRRDPRAPASSSDAAAAPTV